ncbi:MAG: hypothetical protein ACYC46_08320 [Acidobacteriaceae bacterium]
MKVIDPSSRICVWPQLTGVVSVAVLLLLSSFTALQAQAPDQGAGPRGGRGFFGGQPPVHGTVTAVAGEVVTLKTEQGDIYQVYLSDNTRLMKDRQPVKASDIQVGDMLVAAGEVDAGKKTVHAAFAMDVSAEQVRKMREGLGKEWVSGKVTAIDGTTLTIQRIDGVTQKIEVDETTSFRKGRPGRGNAQAADGESITLADIKVGDNVMGRGSIKNNVFVPTTLAVMEGERGGQRRRGENGTPASGAPPQP